MKAETLARWEGKLRPLIAMLPPKLVVSKYAQGRQDFLDKLKQEQPAIYSPPQDFERVLWGICFRSGIFNAAGMFKNGDCYKMVANQGAGAYLAGTTTANPREGNTKEGISLPFVPYPLSCAASNWLGLPNDGDEAVAKKLAHQERVNACPIGVSVMGSPDLNGTEKLEALVKGMKRYEQAGVDFIEMNESCPNTAHGRPQDDDLASRLTYIQRHFLNDRSRKLPVIVKFSNDTEVAQVPPLLDLLFELGFDGVNVGNTSTRYAKLRDSIVERERKLYDFFTTTFSGGVSGRPLKKSSLLLATAAVQYTRSCKPAHEFHVFRTGGIENAEDVRASDAAGISMNLWYTGYFEKFSKDGHNVYRKLYKDLTLR